MAKSSTRRINIYINGKEVEASVKSIRSEMNKLVNEQNHMVIGSDKYTVITGSVFETLTGSNTGTGSVLSLVYNRGFQPEARRIFRAATTELTCRNASFLVGKRDIIRATLIFIRFNFSVLGSST